MGRALFSRCAWWSCSSETQGDPMHREKPPVAPADASEIPPFWFPNVSMWSSYLETSWSPNTDLQSPLRGTQAGPLPWGGGGGPPPPAEIHAYVICRFRQHRPAWGPVGAEPQNQAFPESGEV